MRRAAYHILRPFWIVLGFVSLALGVVGIVLPLLPTTPFVLLAAFCFGKSSPRFAAWLHRHPIAGPIITDWQAHGAIAPRYKALAVGMMGATLGLSLWMGFPEKVVLVQAVVLMMAAIFILSRRNGPVGGGRRDLDGY